MSSFSVSNATADDYPAFVQLYPELGVVHPLPPLEHFAQVIAPDSILVRDGDAVVGFGWARPRRGQLYVVSVIADPAHRRRGVGRRVMQELAKRGHAAGFRRWMLRVKPENVAARRLYGSCGMRDDLEGAQLRMAWADLVKLPSSSPDTTAGPIGPADDRRFEHALGLPPGEFSTYRGTPGRVFMGAEAGDVPIACVASATASSGAPLSARSPAAARAVLEGLAAHASPEGDGLFVTVEGNPELEAALVVAGATVTMRFLRMEGDLAS